MTVKKGPTTGAEKKWDWLEPSTLLMFWDIVGEESWGSPARDSLMLPEPEETPPAPLLELWVSLPALAGLILSAARCCRELGTFKTRDEISDGTLHIDTLNTDSLLLLTLHERVAMPKRLCLLWRIQSDNISIFMAYKSQIYKP
jgi:hypothetical protein